MKAIIQTANGHIKFDIAEDELEEGLEQAQIFAGTYSLLHNAAASQLVKYKVKKNTRNNLIIKMTSPIARREFVAQIRKRGSTYILDIIENKHEESAAEYPKRSKSLKWLFCEHEHYLGAFQYELCMLNRGLRGGQSVIKLDGFDKVMQAPGEEELKTYAYFRGHMTEEEAHRYLSVESGAQGSVERVEAYMDMMEDAA